MTLQLGDQSVVRNLVERLSEIQKYNVHGYIIPLSTDAVAFSRNVNRLLKHDLPFLNPMLLQMIHNGVLDNHLEQFAYFGYGWLS